MTDGELLTRLYLIHEKLLDLVYRDNRRPPNRHTIIDALDDINQSLIDAYTHCNPFQSRNN